MFKLVFLCFISIFCSSLYGQNLASVFKVTDFKIEVIDSSDVNIESTPLLRVLSVVKPDSLEVIWNSETSVGCICVYDKGSLMETESIKLLYRTVGYEIYVVGLGYDDNIRSQHPKMASTIKLEIDGSILRISYISRYMKGFKDVIKVYKE